MTSAALPSRPTESARPSRAASRTSATASSSESVERSRYPVSSRRSIRDGSTSTQSIAAPAMVAASGCAPPIPPSPAVRIVRPREVGRAEMLLAGRRERLVRALEDPLRADVDPASGRHLAEHRQALGLEPPELVPGRPARDEQRVRDQHARRSRVRPQHADGLPALHEQRLVVSEREQRADDRAQCVVVARGLPRAAVDDEVLRPLGDLGVEVVQQHPQRGLRRPRSGVQLGAARRADVAQVAAERLDGPVERVDRRHEDSLSSSNRIALPELPPRVAGRDHEAGERRPGSRPSGRRR